MIIVTPIIKRAHNLKSSGEIVFVDSTSSCDTDNHSIAFMLCPCSAGAVVWFGLVEFTGATAGAVSLAVITKGQTEHLYVKGFQLLNEALEKPFNNKRHPEIFITVDSDAEIKCSAKCLACIEELAQHFPCSSNCMEMVAGKSIGIGFC
ncbi:hypothetical protein AVEN_266037-1 [Araneus ventricosus]|uniref:MULE transposase domain-containing protein n=1 Tax=Araneus ventricosus TaxID=182803 RepID=A0A4Y2S7H0_ARAVE|nr:hypothetical protein AVEN_266037-1 [Araneus ventricosus]